MKKLLMSLALGATLVSLVPSQAGATSVTGPGGVSKLDYLSSAKLLAWNVKPATSWPYHFTGLVTFTGAIHDATAVSGTGFGSEGDTINAKGSKGQFVYATLTGTAYALDGDKFVTMPGAGVGYTK
ncbi:hypothetical protein [Exiguobacterium acetylicum]|uniref:hypothetical protein n=1 Tax=Exiguobacterium acetylicum TaxID=41170 RepID=UPI001CA763D7|nr:hypothetical protein [Exiguobacterium acetylicum]QZY88646.1 hypothetical protein K7G97_17205 [Exiguobacterium acetylicum]